ncbi:aquaporin-9 isoform X2 [Phyllobates terribilis]|uniref:aquaporin-9 isoform X2 n=1 Tax=Phyllobates terribilis TaxID=111132 RepID=UPI003CCA7E9D
MDHLEASWVPLLAVHWESLWQSTQLGECQAMTAQAVLRPPGVRRTVQRAQRGAGRDSDVCSLRPSWQRWRHDVRAGKTDEDGGKRSKMASDGGNRLRMAGNDSGRRETSGNGARLLFKAMTAQAVLHPPGGHVNPAVSFAMCMTGKLSWVKLPFYISAQFLGAFTGSAAAFGVYYDALMKYSGGVFTVVGPNATAHIFATYPSPYLSTLNGLADQMMSTALLLILIFAIFDKKNMPAPSGLEPIAVGLLILTLGLSLGSNSGCAMNPARDLGPRVFTALAGWGSEVFTAGNSFWWIPVVGPMCGAVIGSYIYILCIQAHHKKEPGVLDLNPDIDHFEKHELASMA